MLEKTKQKSNDNFPDDSDFERIDTRFILRDDNIVCCPNCGCDAVHLGAVRVLQGHSTTVCKEDRAEVYPSDRHEHSRGSAIAIQSFCESGCEWLDIQGFHKGTTTRTLYARTLPDPLAIPDQLWRD